MINYGELFDLRGTHEQLAAKFESLGMYIICTTEDAFFMEMGYYYVIIIVRKDGDVFSVDSVSVEKMQ